MVIAQEETPMLSEKCKLYGRKGVKYLERVGPYLVITNKRLHEMGASHRYTLINEADLWVHSIHGSQHAAVVFAGKVNQGSISNQSTIWRLLKR
ncbi:MAG: hypothetical protein ABI970_22080 [Chloroflexota bacterium]